MLQISMTKVEDRLKLIWVNNCKLIEETKSSISKRQKKFNKLKKTLKAYSKNN